MNALNAESTQNRVATYHEKLYEFIFYILICELSELAASVGIHICYGCTVRLVLVFPIWFSTPSVSKHKMF